MKSKDEIEAEFTQDALQQRASLEEIYHFIDLIKYKVNSAIEVTKEMDPQELGLLKDDYILIMQNLDVIKSKIEELAKHICPKELENKYKKERPKF
jgi:hypothetical protein